MPNYEVSGKFKAAVKLSPSRAYHIAHLAGIDPVTLSKIMCGIIEIKPNDPRVLAVARVIGLPAGDCFEEVGPDAR